MRRGFTLLEVVVALAVLGTVLTVGMELLGIGLRSVGTSQDYTRAMLLARRVLDEVAVRPLTPGVVEGTSGSYRWRLDVSQDQDADEQAPAQLLRLRVRVLWAGRWGEKAAELVTLRAAVRDPGPPGTLAAPGPGGRG